jgi:hypothetical protein
MNKKTNKPKQRFVNKNLEHPDKKTGKKGKTILVHPPTKPETDEELSDGSGGAFSDTENVEREED